jgi:hypothetical protein
MLVRVAVNGFIVALACITGYGDSSDKHPGLSCVTVAMSSVHT